MKGDLKMSEVGFLDGKIAVITGSRRGIGKAIALAFAEAGADVAVCGQTGDDVLAAVAEEIRKLGQRSIAIRADVSHKADVDNLVQRVMDEFGRIDVLVNNAGMWIPGQTVLECSEENWDRVMDVNLKGTFLCSQAIGKIMVEQKCGNIINVASRAGVFPRPRAGAYCSSKAAMIMLTRQLSLELADYNIRVNAVAPGFVKTDMNIHLRITPEDEKRIAEGIMMGRLGESEEIGKLCVFLASDYSSYITGQTIVADGGGDRPIVAYKLR